MNRKQKIIVSITGIILVSLILIGLTYAYFLTKITGNTNSKSISVTTANLAIVYDDNSAEILGKDLILEPNSEKEIGTKTFTVTNKGNAKTSYVVVIDETKITNAADGTTTTFESNDFRYTLTCTEGCNGVGTQSVFPINGGVLVGNSIDVGIVQTYELKLWYIDTGIDQTNDMNKRLEARINITDATALSNSLLTNKNSLAYNIINSARNKTNGTELLSVPRTKVVEQFPTEYVSDPIKEYEKVSTNDIRAGTASWLVGNDKDKLQEGNGDTVDDYKEAVGKYVYSRAESWIKKLVAYDETTSMLTFENETTKNEQSLNITNDMYGTSYYYRGNVEDNYVNFANKCWRIVRIQGDGSIKLILQDQDNLCNSSNLSTINWDIPLETGGTVKTASFGYKSFVTFQNEHVTVNGYIADYLHSEVDSMATGFKDFQKTFSSSELSKLKSGDWCIDDKIYTKTGDAKPYTFTMVNKTGDELFNYKKNSILESTEYYYKSGIRLSNDLSDDYAPTLNCDGKVMADWDDVDKTPMYVGTLTADEIFYTGAKTISDGVIYSYLTSREHIEKTLNEELWYNTLSLYGRGNSDSSTLVYKVGPNARLNTTASAYLSHKESMRPSIILKSDTIISSGDGTISNPYVIG